MGVEPGSLLTTSALLTAVIGLSLQDTLGNLFAGLSIQAQRPFEVGDWIALDEDSRNVGRVIEINWRATTVLTNDQVELVIPNGVLAKTTIRNFTKPTKVSRRTVEVEAPYDVSPRRVEEALLSAAHAVQGLLASPPPAVLVRRFGESGIVYHLNIWIDDFSIRDRVESSVRQRVWSAFQRAGISIPFPVRTVHVHAVTPESQAEELKQEVESRKASLEEVDFIAALPEAPRARLAALSRTCHFMPGEVVIRQGDPGSELFIVQKGEVTVLVGAAGERLRGGAARPWEVFRGNVLDDGRAARGDGAGDDGHRARRGRQAGIQEVLAKEPRLAESITRALVERQSALEENLSMRASRTRDEVAEKSTALLAKIREFFAI